MRPGRTRGRTLEEGGGQPGARGGGVSLRLLCSMAIRRRRDVLEDPGGTPIVRRSGPRPGEVFGECYWGSATGART